jgi:DNA-binding NarL/FixJ family response regulator
MTTRILIADDDVSIRRLLCRILEEHSDWQVCGAVANGQNAVMRVADLNPDVVILDLAMPQMNGLQAAQEISARFPLLPLLLLTVQEVSSELMKAAQKAGFSGAVSKSTGAEVVKAVEALLRERSFFTLSRSGLPGLTR